MLAVPHINAAAALAPRAHRLRGLQVPHTRMIHELGGEQRAHRAQIDHVVGVDVEVEVGVFGGTDERMVAAIHGTERLRARHFVGEADTERAHNAPLVVQNNAVGQREELGGVRFGVARLGRCTIQGVVIILQQALTRLVADATVNRVVERDELHRVLIERLDLLRLGEHAHAGGHGHVAGDIKPRVARILLNLHHTNAAVAGHRQLRMPAEVRDVHTIGACGLNHRLAVFRLHRHAIDGEVEHFLGRNGCHRSITHEAAPASEFANGESANGSSTVRLPSYMERPFVM